VSPFQTWQIADSDIIERCWQTSFFTCVDLRSGLLYNLVAMRFSVSSILLAASCLLGASRGHNIQLAAHGRECFHEQLHKDDKMTVTFQVGDREFGTAGNLDVDFWVWTAGPSFY
jgi:hypothetical protein